MRIYLIGSLRNDRVPIIGNTLREHGFEVFDDWKAAGPEADDYWMEYEKARGRTYKEALRGAAAKNVFQFDRRNLMESDVAVLVTPAGKSGHLELGWMAGRGKRTYVLFEDEPERWDVMYQFTNDVFTNLDDLIHELKNEESIIE